MSGTKFHEGAKVAESPVGPGEITGFSERGFPMVNHTTVARLTLADGSRFDPYDTYPVDQPSPT